MSIQNVWTKCAGKVRPIVFTDILANGVPFTSSSLKYNQNNLTFCFTDFAYGLPSALLYEYRLEGVDKDWKLLAAQNEVSYYGLSSGTYTFRVRLPGNEQSEASCQVTVCPMIPWWGWGLSVLLIVGIIAFIRYYVWKRMRRLLVFFCFVDFSISRGGDTTERAVCKNSRK